MEIERKWIVHILLDLTDRSAISYQRYFLYIGDKVKFSSEGDAKSFEPLDWFGREITNSPLGKDRALINLSEEEFDELCVEYGD
jgi:hypothetical protein